MVGSLRVVAAERGNRIRLPLEIHIHSHIGIVLAKESKIFLLISQGKNNKNVEIPKFILNITINMFLTVADN